MRVNDVVRGRVEGMTREVESGTRGCRGKKALRIMWIVCRQDCGSAWACAAREALRRCADIEIARPGKAAAEEREFAG